MSRLVRTSFALVMTLGLASVADAAEFNMDVKLDGVQLGESVMGPKVSLSDMKGRVVLLEFWGIRCGPCLASLPHVSKLSEDYSAFGLVVVGAHAQQGTPEQIRDTAKSRGVSFAVVQNARVKDGDDFNGIPHCMLFDHNGKCIYRGHPGQVDAKIKQAVGVALADKVGSELPKPLAALSDSLRKGQAPAGVLQKALALSKSSEGPMATQAKEFVSKLTELADKQLVEAQSQRSEDPVAALPRFVRLSTDFKGTPTGTKAAETAAELKKDKAVMGEIKVRPILQQLRSIETQLDAVLNGGDPKAPEFKRSQGGVLKQIQTTVNQMKKTAADAPSTKAAIEIAEKYGLTIK